MSLLVALVLVGLVSRGALGHVDFDRLKCLPGGRQAPREKPSTWLVRFHDEVTQKSIERALGQLEGILGSVLLGDKTMHLYGELFKGFRVACRVDGKDGLGDEVLRALWSLPGVDHVAQSKRVYAGGPTRSFIKMAAENTAAAAASRDVSKGNWGNIVMSSHSTHLTSPLTSPYTPL